MAGPSCSTCSASIELQIDGDIPKFCHSCRSTLALTLEDFILDLSADLCPGCGASIKQSIGGRTVSFCSKCGYRMVNEPQTEKQTVEANEVEPVPLERPLLSHPFTEECVSQSASEVEVLPTVDRCDALELLNKLAKKDESQTISTRPNSKASTVTANVDNDIVPTQPAIRSVAKFDGLTQPTIKVLPDSPAATSPPRPNVKKRKIREKKIITVWPNPRVTKATEHHVVQSNKVAPDTVSTLSALPHNTQTYSSKETEAMSPVSIHSSTTAHGKGQLISSSKGGIAQITDSQRKLEGQPSSDTITPAPGKPAFISSESGKKRTECVLILDGLNKVISTVPMAQQNNSISTIKSGKNFSVPRTISLISASPSNRLLTVKKMIDPPDEATAENIIYSRRTLPKILQPIKPIPDQTSCSNGNSETQVKTVFKVLRLMPSKKRKQGAYDGIIETYNDCSIPKHGRFGCSNPILTHITPDNTDKLSAPDKLFAPDNSSLSEGMSASTSPTSEGEREAITAGRTVFTVECVKRESSDDIADIPHKLVGMVDSCSIMQQKQVECEKTAMNGLDIEATDELCLITNSKDAEGTCGVINAGQTFCTVEAVKRESCDEIADTPHKLVCVDDSSCNMQQSQSEAQNESEALQNIFVPSDEHASMHRDDLTTGYRVPDDVMDVNGLPTTQEIIDEEQSCGVSAEILDERDSPTKQEMIEEEVTVRQISEYCVVCNFHPGSDQLLAQHYTDEHTAPILHVFNVSHLYNSRKPIHSSRIPKESQTSHPQYKDFVPATHFKSGEVALQKKVPKHTEGVIHCGADDCDMSFISYVDWKLHQQDKHQDSEALLKCPDCGIIMIHSAMIRHIDDKRTDDNEEKCARCYNCKIVMRERSYKGGHIQKCDLASLSSELVTVCYICAEMDNCWCSALKCDQCGKLFLNETKLSRHQNAVHHKSIKSRKTTQYLYRCPLCEYSHTLHTKLTVHIQTHLDEATRKKAQFECTICTYKHRVKMGLYRHVSEAHFRLNITDQCQRCDIIMDSLTAGWNHILSHHGGDKSVVPASQKGHKCLICGGAMEKLAELKKHVFKHKLPVSYESSDQETTDKSCDKCGFEFQSYCQRVYHTTTVHQPGINCILCEASFGYALDLQRHLQEVHGTMINGSDTVPCRLCDKELEVGNAPKAFSHTIKQHCDSLNVGRIDSIIECGICKSPMQTVQDYVTHGCISVSMIKCVICFQECDSKEHLSDHIKTSHLKGSGRRLIACKSCYRVFESTTQLNSHHNNIHGKEANCIICFAPFSTVNECLEHADTHFQKSVEDDSTYPAELQKCLFCRKVIRSIEDSREHLQAHYEPSLSISNSTCCDCSETLINAADAMRHSRMHQKEKCEGDGSVSHDCAVCKLVFHDEIVSLVAHTKTHFAIPRSQALSSMKRTMHVKCLTCSFEAKTTRALCLHYKVRHMVSSHNYEDYTDHRRKSISNQDDYPYPCPFCDYGKKHLALLESHVLLHFRDAKPSSGYQLLTCTLCMENFSNSAALYRHVSLRCNLSGRRTCQQCDIELTDAKSAWSHVSAHQHNNYTLLILPENVPPLCCVFCDAEIHSLRDAIMHSKLHGQNQHKRKRSCPQTNASALAYSANRNISNKCDECGLQAESFCKLQFHRTTKHSPSITCVLCQNPFAYVQELECHLRKEHSFDSTVLCTLCGEGLAGSEECIEHAMTGHSNHLDTSRFTFVKTIECSICSTKLTNISDYLSHGEMSLHCFMCVICFEEFSERDVLEEHLKDHSLKNHSSRARLYTCDSCERVFHTRGNRCTHRNVVHGKEINCHICFSAFGCMKRCFKHIEEHYDMSEAVVKEYSCRFCLKLLRSKESSIEHAKAHYEPALCGVQCRVCSDKLSNDIDAINHVVLHQTEKKIRLECVICERTNDTQERLQDHVISHFRPKMIHVKCLECDFVATSTRGLCKHYKKGHTMSPSRGAKPKEEQRGSKRIKAKECYECEVCDFKCHRKTVLNDHILLCHLGDGPFACSHCDEVLQTKELLIAHLKQVEKARDCHICGKSTSYLADHLKRKHCDRACGHCEYVTNISGRHLEDHIRANHINRLTCEVCDMVYDTDAQIEAHLAVYSTMPIYTCELCEFRTHYRQIVVEEHMQAIHGIAMPRENQLASTEALPYQCSFCPEKFGTSDLVNTHINSLHKNELGSWECHSCKVKFRLKAFLLNHQIAVHNKARAFSCETCSAMFHTQSRLNRHIQFVHESSRIYNCELCDKTFKRKDHLTQHIHVVHQGNKYWYRCQQCGVKFPQKSNLSKHMEEEHMCIGFTAEAYSATHRRRQKESYQCDQCDEVFTLRSSLAEHVIEVHREGTEGQYSDDETDGEWEPNNNDDSDDSDYSIT